MTGTALHDAAHTGRFVWSRFDDLQGRQCERIVTTWPEFTEQMLHPPEYPSKTAMPLLKLATFGAVRTAAGALRHDGNLLEVFGVEGDHDAGTMQPDEAADLLQQAGLEALVLPTASHTPAAPHWRVLCPLARPVSKAERTDYVAALNGVLKGSLARESFTASQAFYFGKLADHAYEAFHVAGAPIDTRIADLPTAPVDGGKARTAIEDADTDGSSGRAPSTRPPLGMPTEKQRELLKLFDPDMEYLEWIRYGQALHHEATGAESGFQLWLEWSMEGASFADTSETDMRRSWKSFGKNHAAQVTLRSIIRDAHRAGYVFAWEPPGTLQFEDVSDPTAEPSVPLERNAQGKILPTMVNLCAVLSRPSMCGSDIRFDTFLGSVVRRPASGGEWASWEDTDYAAIRMTLERMGFIKAQKADVRDAVLFVAQQRKFDSATNWLNGLRWDGVPRVAGFMHTHFGCDNTPYAAAVSRYLWTGLAGRVLAPGCKADAALLLIGDQGAGKSSGVAAIAPWNDAYAEFHLGAKTDDLARKMRGTLVGELSELAGMSAKATEELKAWLSKQVERWTPKYVEHETSYPRRCLFIATSNDDEPLTDSTGNRRWLPLKVGQVDVDAIKHDCIQLWAEAATLHRETGIAYCEAEKLAAQEHSSYMASDAWTPIVVTWLETPGDLEGEPAPGTQEFLTAADILRGAIGLKPGQIARRESQRINSVMTGLGWTSTRRRRNGTNPRGFVRSH